MTGSFPPVEGVSCCTAEVCSEGLRLCECIPYAAAGLSLLASPGPAAAEEPAGRHGGTVGLHPLHSLGAGHVSFFQRCPGAARLPDVFRGTISVQYTQPSLFPCYFPCASPPNNFICYFQSYLLGRGNFQMEILVSS